MTKRHTSELGLDSSLCQVVWFEASFNIADVFISLYDLPLEDDDLVPSIVEYDLRLGIEFLHLQEPPRELPISWGSDKATAYLIEWAEILGVLTATYEVGRWEQKKVPYRIARVMKAVP